MSVDSLTEVAAMGETTLPNLSRSAAKIGKLSTIYTLGSIAPQVITLLLLPVFTHYLWPEQMGIVMLATGIMGPLGILVQLGLWSGLKVQYFRLEEAVRPSLVRTILLGQTVQGLAVCLLLSVAGIWLAERLLPNLPLDRPCTLALWLMLVWGCLFQAMIQLAAGLSQLLERAAVSVGINFLNYLLQTALGVLAVVGLGWLGLGRQGTIFAASVVAAAVSFHIVWRLGRGGFDGAMFRRASLLGLSFVPHQFSGLLALAANKWILNFLDSTAAVAIYGMAVSFVVLMDMPLFSFNNAAYPTLAKLMNDGSPAAMRQQSRLYTLQIIAVVALNLGVSLFAPLAITILTDASYHSATAIVPILVFGWLFHGLYLVVSQPVFFFGGGLWLAAASVSSTVVSIALGIALIPTYGIDGAAWAMVGNQIVGFAVAAWASRRLYRLPWEIGKIFRALACGVALAAADCWLSANISPLVALPLKVALWTALAPLLWVTGVVSAAELRRAREIVVNKLAAWTNRPETSC